MSNSQKEPRRQPVSGEVIEIMDSGNKKETLTPKPTIALGAPGLTPHWETQSVRTGGSTGGLVKKVGVHIPVFSTVL